MWLCSRGSWVESAEERSFKELRAQSGENRDGSDWKLQDLVWNLLWMTSGFVCKPNRRRMTVNNLQWWWTGQISSPFDQEASWRMWVSVISLLNRHGKMAISQLMLTKAARRCSPFPPRCSASLKYVRTPQPAWGQTQLFSMLLPTSCPWYPFLCTPAMAVLSLFRHGLVTLTTV